MSNYEFKVDIKDPFIDPKMRNRIKKLANHFRGTFWEGYLQNKKEEWYCRDVLDQNLSLIYYSNGCIDIFTSQSISMKNLKDIERILGCKLEEIRIGEGKIKLWFSFSNRAKHRRVDTRDEIQHLPVIDPIVIYTKSY